MKVRERKIINSVIDGDFHETKKLLDLGVNVDSQDEKKQSVLMLATKQNNVEIAKLLIDYGADVNLRDETKLTPWICAAANGFHEILEYGAPHSDVNLVNRFGGTALLPSSEKGFLKTVEVAIKSKVPINHINDLNWSALQEAVVLGNGMSSYHIIIRLLLDNGANMNFIDDYGKTALDWAKEYNQEYVQLLLTNKIDRNSNSEKLLDAILTDISNDDYEAGYKKSKQGIDLFKSPEFYFLQGYTKELQHEYDIAINLYEEGLDQSSEFYFYIANAYRRKKNTQKVIETYNKAIDLDPEYFFYRYHLSNYLREIGDHSKAIEQMNILLEQNPSRYDFAFHKANSLKACGQEKKASVLLAQFNKD